MILAPARQLRPSATQQYNEWRHFFKKESLKITLAALAILSFTSAIFALKLDEKTGAVTLSAVGTGFMLGVLECTDSLTEKKKAIQNILLGWAAWAALSSYSLAN